MTGIFPIVNATNAKVTEIVQLMIRLKWKGMNCRVDPTQPFVAWRLSGDSLEPGRMLQSVRSK
jgi:hypothetical protein